MFAVYVRNAHKFANQKTSMYYKLLQSSLFIFLIPIIAQAQLTDSAISKFAADNAPEKMFIHFDKSIYSKDETIWFKAYLTVGNQPSTQSKSFYIDWFDAKGDLVQHQVFPVFQASAKGQFTVPKNYSSEQIFCKAYTKWMLNFDTSFLFEKEIIVLQANTKAKQNIAPITTVNFFPEGGEMVDNISCFVAFKATNQFGQPVAIKGVIKNNLGEVIDSIRTEHDGMGICFMQTPSSNNQYTAYWQDSASNTQQQTTLPQVATTGATMQVQTVGKNLLAIINRSKVVSDDKKYLRLYGMMHNQIVYNAKFSLVNKTNIEFSIPIDSLPTGILQLTLFNDSYLPLAERIYFVNNNNYSFKTQISPVETNINKRRKNKIEIDVEDSLLTNMSIAITDVNVAYDNSNSIYSQLLLSSELKGNIANPAYYLANNNEITQAHLDLVMLTNGWRKYNWQQIANSKRFKKTFTADSIYIQLIGNCYGLDKSDLLPDQSVLIFLQAKDSSRKQMFLPVKKDGTFTASNLIFFDTLRVYYSFVGNKKLNRVVEPVFTNGLVNYTMNLSVANYLNRHKTIDFAAIDRQRKMEESYNKLQQLKGGEYLSAVELKSKVKRSVDVLDEKYTTGVFGGGDAYQFDVINDFRAAGSLNVFNYLTGFVAGLQINQNGGETNVSWRGAGTDFYVDEMKTDAEAAGMLSMSEIAYIKVFRPPFFGGLGGSAGGAIAIYTRKGNDVKYTGKGGLPFKILAGYTAFKEFYNPNYERNNDITQPDTRTTLYWNPYVITDKHKKQAIVEFYNNDVTKKFRLVLCGMNEDGKMIQVEKMLE